MCDVEKKFLYNNSLFLFLIDSVDIAHFLMINVYERAINRRIHCGRRLCGYEIGLLRNDNMHVLLQSYRLGRLLHVTTVTEHRLRHFTTIVANRLVEEEDYLLNNQSFR